MPGMFWADAVLAVTSTAANERAAGIEANERRVFVIAIVEVTTELRQETCRGLVRPKMA